METVVIGGVPTRTWKNALPNLAALARLGRTHGGRVFTIHKDERVTYDSWFRATAALAAEFARLGIVPGDRIALAMRNLPEWPVVFFAATSLGAIIAPLNTWWTGDELRYALSDSGSSLLVCDDERWARIQPHTSALPALAHVLVARSPGSPSSPARALEDVIGGTRAYADLPDAELPDVVIAPDDNATIFYTSGTTGSPKGALGSHRNILTNILSTGYATLRSVLRRGDPPPEPRPRVVLTVIPLFHVTACNAGLMTTIATGGTAIFVPKWDTVEAFEIIEREKVNVAGGVPTLAWQLLEHPDRGRYNLSSIETIAYGGAPAAPELVRRIHAEFGAMPGNGWGMTETSATVTTHSAEDYLARPDSCGPPVPVADIRIMDEDGTRELPIGEVGEIWASGPMIVKGYWGNAEATAATFIDGWVRTGDLARVDAEGYCYIVDRAKDMVIRGGENIYSSEVENVLFEHPAITDSALIGIPHRTLGEEPAAIVQLAPGAHATEDELKAWIRARLAVFKTPVRILFSADPLPRNANGKILKKQLGALFDEPVRAHPASPLAIDA
jgi:acyl-CoA synthetase (AMP-forming)/AMP-acid ligase II